MADLLDHVQRRESLRAAVTGARDHAADRVHRRIDRWVPEPVQRFVAWLRSDDFFSTSASLAYYALVSLAPMVLVALWVAGAVVGDEALEGLGSGVDEEAPDQLPIGDLLRSLIEVATTVGFVSVLGALWPATAYGVALGRAFGRITPDEERRVRGLKARLSALVIVGMLPLLVLSGIALLFVGPRLLPDAGPWLTVVSALAVWVGVAVLVAAVYTLFRMRDTTPGDVAVGALVAATLMGVATGGYVVYLELFADFEENYGSTGLATAVLLGLWLLLTNAMLLVGYRLMLRKALLRGAERGRDVDEEQAEQAAEPDAGREPRSSDPQPREAGSGGGSAAAGRR